MTYQRSPRNLSSVVVEYEKNGKRVTKTFADMNRAKSFYVAKDKAGKSPKIVSASK